MLSWASTELLTFLSHGLEGIVWDRAWSLNSPVEKEEANGTIHSVAIRMGSKIKIAFYPSYLCFQPGKSRANVWNALEYSNMTCSIRGMYLESRAFADRPSDFWIVLLLEFLWVECQTTGTIDSVLQQNPLCKCWVLTRLNIWVSCFLSYMLVELGVTVHKGGHVCKPGTISMV